MKPLPQGKGLYVWMIKSMPVNWVEEFKRMGIRWIAVKVADGVNSFNLRPLDNGGWSDDILQPFINKARAAGIRVGGWQYVYGFNPLDEAEKAAKRIEKFALDFFLIDAEGEYQGKHTQASQYSQLLRKLAPHIPIALSSYRFPDKFPTFPFAEFLQHCDFNAPQVYWNKAKAAAECRECYYQYQRIKDLPYIPAGRAYFGEGFPEPTPLEVNNFMEEAQDLDAPAAFFWSADFLYHRLHKEKMTPIREAIAAYKWDVDEPQPDPPEPPLPVPSEAWASVEIDGVNYEGELKRV